MEKHMSTLIHDSKASSAALTDGPAVQESEQPVARQDKAAGTGELRGVPEVQPPSGVFTLIADRFLAWRERRFVAQASKELLALYQTASLTHPEWTRRQLYQLVVMLRTGCEPTAADNILDAAQEGYAQWPSSHELNLCDVAHYLSVTEFLAIHPGKRWMQSSLTPVVASQVPSEFCVERDGS